MNADNKVSFTTKINSTVGDIKTISANAYEQVCKRGDCYEVIPDDRPIKLYFDTDIKYEGDYLDCYTEGAVPFIKEGIKRVINETFKNENLPVEPILHFATSNSPSFIDFKKKTTLAKISIHTVVENIIASKKQQDLLVKYLNKNLKLYFTDFEDYIGIGNKLFDESVYDKNRKLRSLYASKPNENRPLIINEGTFEGLVISAFIPENAFLLPELQGVENPKTHTNNIVCNKTETNNYNRIYVERFLEEGLLDKYSVEYIDWRNIGFILKYEFKEDGWELFKVFSNLTPSKYDELSCRDHWDKWDENPAKPLTIASLINMVKKDNKEKYTEIHKEINKLKAQDKKIPKTENSFHADTDEECGTIIYNMLEPSIIGCKGQIFMKHGNIWINNPDLIKAFIIDFVMKAHIVKKYKDNEISYWANYSPAEKIYKVIINKVALNPKNDLYTKFHTTTKGRICFMDGVLDFKQRRFYKWEEIDFEYYSCVMIKRNFENYYNNPNRDVIEEIKEKIYKNMYGDKVETALHFFSRGIAGYSEDKNLATYCGNRDCGKGVQYDNLSYGFEDYVKTFELGNILYNRKTSGMENVDCSKKLYWLLDLEFARLGISQEIPDHKSELKANSKMVKKIAGGGDTIVARRNYDRVDSHFTIDTTFAIFGNNSLQFDNDDCKEHIIEFNSVNQFKTKEYIDKLREDGVDELELQRYKVKDYTIKEKTQTEEWRNAIVYLLYENFKNEPVSILKTEEIEDVSLLGKIRELYTISNNNDNIIPCEEVYSSLSDFDKKKIDNELLSMNVFKKRCYSGDYRKKWCFYGLVMLREETENTDTESM